MRVTVAQVRAKFPQLRELTDEQIAALIEEYWPLSPPDKLDLGQYLILCPDGARASHHRSTGRAPSIRFHTSQTTRTTGHRPWNGFATDRAATLSLARGNTSTAMALVSASGR